MKDAASTAQREQNQRQGLIVGTITLPFRLLGVLIGSLLFSIVVECIGMHLFWKDQGWRHSQQMLQYEVGHLSSHFTRSVVVQEPRSEEHTSELQSLMRISYAVFCLKKKNTQTT